MFEGDTHYLTLEAFLWRNRAQESAEADLTAQMISTKVTHGSDG